MVEYDSKLDQLAWLWMTKPEAVTLEELGLTPDDLGTACELTAVVPASCVAWLRCRAQPGERAVSTQGAHVFP